MSEIEWTDETWNPATGCTKVSPGCRNCYAEQVAAKLKKWGQKKYENGFEYTEHEDYVEQPLHWAKPRKIFVNSMSDLFHEDATIDFLNKVFYVMEQASWHQYQILTKRPERMLSFFETKFCPSHIWLGTSIEGMAQIHRLETLKKIDAPIKFVSFEPLLGEIDNIDLKGIQWAIVGGESGPRFRDVIKKEWVIKLRDICKRDGVAFFFKQWGGKKPKSKGNLLDGKIYQEYPGGNM